MTSSELERAGAFIQSVIATDRDSDPLAHVRFAEALSRESTRRTNRRRLAVVGSFGIAILAVLWTARALQPQVLTYRIESPSQPASEPGALGSYMSAPPQAPLGLQFSEGSRVVLQPRARGRVAQTSRHGATMVLEDGGAHAEIKHLDQTDWRVLAGPFVVGVKGTTFDVSFDVETQVFELRMQSGMVQVTGPGLKEPVEVTDRQRLVLSARPDAPTARPDAIGAATISNRALEDASDAPDARAFVPLPSGPTPSPQCSAPASSHAGVAALRRSAPNESESETFSQLGAHGQHQRIVELAERRGFDSTIASASRADLLALGNAARFSGRMNLASMAYRAIRERFARSTEATASAFFLGRLSESNSPAQAVVWYERYVAEAPNGVWVADALGRRMVVLNESKATANAQTAAQEYLARFPAGPYAGFARKLLGP
ncbi:MAG TPA: FecR domain-containing protein [Polyangiaceae bacterium]